MKTLIKHLVAVAAVAGLAAGSVYAIPTLKLTDGTNTVVIADGSVIPGLADLSPLVGVVSWSGTVGDWYLNVTTGQTAPTLGTLANPQMDLNSVDNSHGAGWIQIWFSADNYTGPGGTAIAQTGGTLDSGTVRYETGWSSSNILFSGVVLTDHLFTFPSPFSGADTASFAAGPGPYSLTQVIIVAHDQGGTTSFDANLKIPDGGTTALLLGLGLLGVGFVARRFKSVKA